MKTTRSEAPTRRSSLNPDTLDQLLGQMVNDLGAAVRRQQKGLPSHVGRKSWVGANVFLAQRQAGRSRA